MKRTASSFLPLCRPAFRRTWLGVLLVLLVSAPGLRAGKPVRFEDVQDASLWRLGSNAAGVRLDTVSVSEALISADGEYGAYRPASGAPVGWTAGALGRTQTHTRRFSMAGTFAFRQFTTYRHCGSMLQMPQRYPVDILEFTPGIKSRQSYSLSGVIGIPLGRGWIIGAGLNFESQNCAKRKDLRYTMYMLDFALTPSVIYQTGPWAFGASFLFERNTQGVNAERVGESGVSYDAFLDKGAYMGVSSLWTAGNVHLTEPGISGFPIDENAFGGALQVQYASLLIEGRYLRRAGRIGEKQQVWFNYFSDEAALRLAWNVTAAHWLRFELQYRSSLNQENILEKVSDKGVTITQWLGSLPIWRERNWQARAAYTWREGPWRADAGLGLTTDAALSTQIYPGYALLGEGRVGLAAALRRSLGPCDLSLTAEASKGWSSRSYRDEGGLVRPDFLADWYEADIAYRTAPAFAVGLAVRYNFPFGLYLDLSGRYRQGFGLGKAAALTGAASDAPFRVGAALSVGYNF